MITDSPPAIIIYAPMRCRCRTCLRLDVRYPGEGYQLALFPYREEKRPKRPITLMRLVA